MTAQRRKLALWSQLGIIAATLALGSGAILVASKVGRPTLAAADAMAIGEAKEQNRRFRPTAAQWATLAVQPVEMHTFRAEHLTEGKIAVDEDHSTPIFTLYAGRITKLLAAPGDTVPRGQPLFVLEAGDSVQAQNDFIAALTGVNKAQAQLRLSETAERRLHNLFDAKAMPLKDWQQAQADLTSAQNDLRGA